MPTPVADFEGLLRAFADRNVSSVIIGGVSAALQGVPTVTYDKELIGMEKDLTALPEYRLFLQEIEAREAKKEPGV